MNCCFFNLLCSDYCSRAREEVKKAVSSLIPIFLLLFSPHTLWQVWNIKQKWKNYTCLCPSPRLHHKHRTTLHHVSIHSSHFFDETQTKFQAYTLFILIIQHISNHPDLTLVCQFFVVVIVLLHIKRKAQILNELYWVLTKAYIRVT